MSDVRSRYKLGTSESHDALIKVDRIVRQAVRACWLMLRKEDRSVARVEVTMNLLVRGALRDLREDPEAFDVLKPSGSYQERLAEIRAEYPKAYKAWTGAEDELLKSKFKEGIGIERLAKIFKRQRGAIQSRIRKLGLVDGPVTSK